VTYKEALHVLVSIDEPTCNAVGSVTDHFAGLWFEDIYSVDSYSNLSVRVGDQVDIWLSKDNEEISLAGVLEILCHMQIGIHPGYENGHVPERVELGGVGFIVECTGDQDIETCISRFACSRNEVCAEDGSKLWANEDCRTLLCIVSTRATTCCVLGLRAEVDPVRQQGVVASW
jgi:hypothetical protein